MSLKETIQAAVNDPEELERIYRNHAKGFAQVYGQAMDHTSLVYRCWKARLAGDDGERFSLDGHRLWGLVIVCLLAGAAARWFLWGDTDSFEKTFSAAMTPYCGMLVFTLMQRGWPVKNAAACLGCTALVWLWVVFLPVEYADTKTLCILFAPFVLWSVFGVARLGGDLTAPAPRVAYLQFFGEFLLVATILTLGGVVLILLTLALLDLLSLNSDYAFDLAIFGGAAVPVVAAWATDRYAAANRLVPLVAQLFAPLLLFVVVAYMVGAVAHVEALFTYRDELLAYNVLMLCVLGVSVFSLTGIRGESSSRLARRIVFWLLATTVIFDLVAVAAISWRLWSFGITANRVAVLGSNLAVLGNILVMARGYYRHLYGQDELVMAESALARYLPVYTAWTAAVFFLFPLIFRY